jgi:hypothetical protein
MFYRAYQGYLWFYEGDAVDTKTPFAAVRPSRFKGAKYIGAN